jgi:hypothetical protein
MKLLLVQFLLFMEKVRVKLKPVKVCFLYNAPHHNIMTSRTRLLKYTQVVLYP